MADEDTIRMANQIAAFFAAYDEAEAVSGIAGHVNAFWTPAMRRALAACAASEAAERLDPLVVKAVPAVRQPSDASA